MPISLGSDQIEKALSRARGGRSAPRPDGTTYAQLGYITDGTADHLLRCMNHWANIGGIDDESFDPDIADVIQMPKRSRPASPCTSDRWLPRAT